MAIQDKKEQRIGYPPPRGISLSTIIKKDFEKLLKKELKKENARKLLKESRLKSLEDLLKELLRPGLKKRRKKEMPDWLKEILEKEPGGIPLPDMWPPEGWKKDMDPGMGVEGGWEKDMDPGMGVEGGWKKDMDPGMDPNYRFNILPDEEKNKFGNRRVPVSKGNLLNQGGIMDIDRMTAPLGYYRGGSPVAPESYEGFEPIHTGYAEAIANMNNPEYARKWNMTRPRQPGLDEQLMQDYEPPRPRWDKARELGKKGLEGIKELGSKSIDVLRKLLGSKAAEAGTYIPDSVLEEMTIEELVKEIQLFDIGLFGNPVRPNDISHLRELTDALEKQMGKYK